MLVAIEAVLIAVGLLHLGLKKADHKAQTTEDTFIGQPNPEAVKGPAPLLPVHPIKRHRPPGEDADEKHWRRMVEKEDGGLYELGRVKPGHSGSNLELAQSISMAKQSCFMSPKVAKVAGRRESPQRPLVLNVNPRLLPNLIVRLDMPNSHPDTTLPPRSMVRPNEVRRLETFPSLPSDNSIPTSDPPLGHVVSRVDYVAEATAVTGVEITSLITGFCVDSKVEFESRKKVVPTALGRSAKKPKGDGPSFGKGGPIKRAKLHLGHSRGRPKNNKGDPHYQKKFKSNKVIEMGESKLKEVSVVASEELQLLFCFSASADGVSCCIGFM
ncbi:hypothetical protein ACE6H2_006846 [Prunus campanulata]